MAEEDALQHGGGQQVAQLVAATCNGMNHLRLPLQLGSVHI